MNAINYRVKKISGGGDWLAHQNAALKISVGSEYHEGSKLQAALEWAAARFSHLHICVADTLQRHNLYSSLAADEAAKVSLRLGDNWIERNQHFFRAVGVPYSIWRWDHWLNDQRYAPARALIEAQHHCDQALSDTLDMDVLGYLNRHGLTPGAPGYESRKQNGMDYLKKNWRYSPIGRIRFRRRKFIRGGI